VCARAAALSSAFSLGLPLGLPDCPGWNAIVMALLATPRKGRLLVPNAADEAPDHAPCRHGIRSI
jgi:hypothetical protein